MFNVVRRSVVVAGCLLVAQPAIAAEQISGNLVSATWLESNRNRADVLILDASPAQIYAAKHIPGAVSVDFLTYGFPERPTADMEQRYQSWGVSPEKTIVMYDQGGSIMATRLFFSLYYHGFPAPKLLVLDGGLAKWQELGLPVSAEPTPPRPKGSFKVWQINEGARVRLTEVLAGSGDRENTVLVEALGPDWHYGEVVAFQKGGHIPHAVLMPSEDFFNPDKTFKSPADIKRMAAYLGIRPEQRVYTHCGGGVAASVPFFALKFIANYPRVALYTESQMGWLSDDRELPYWTYDAPYLMRQTSWLQSWGSQRMRMFGASQISVVDVRSAAAFNEGHVTYALNIPGEVFRSHVTDPDKLAALLGPAGVNALHEAVIVSGAGLTPDAALAFVMLEKLGQKKVSILMDSLEEWMAFGSKLTKDATVVGTQKVQGVSIPPTTYPRNLRKDVITSDPKGTAGLYPRVFIASGKTTPAAAPDGTVVHVPYTDLLNADGTPKAAKEIWKILTKAGIPRYAELVCFSEDPGEAAVNYFVLKLMGYPDVKVWVRSASAPTQ